MAVISAAVWDSQRNGSSGIRWPIRVATVITTALRMMAGVWTGCRCSSSSIIVVSQLSRLAVMVSTTRSSSSPAKPLAA